MYLGSLKEISLGLRSLITPYGLFVQLIIFDRFHIFLRFRYFGDHMRDNIDRNPFYIVKEKTYLIFCL